MTAPEQENQVQISDKELNFRKLEAKYQQEVAMERSKREEIERRMNELSQKSEVEEVEDDSEPYVDHKKLEKKLAKYDQKARKETQSEIQRAVQHAIKEEKKDNWLKTHSDFDQVMEHAEKIYHKDPELAEAILEMPPSFERQKLVYKSIKNMGLDKPAEKQQSIQEKIDSNRRAPFYQPSSVGAAPYASAGDYSASGQKQAYDKMKELQARLRL
jgi:hypothetical protein